MFEKVLLLFSCTFVLSGCVFTDEPMPRITHIYSSELVEPLPPKPTRIAYGNIPRRWIPAFEIEMDGYNYTSFRHEKWKCSNI
jgi:hypothetical protein